MRVVRENVFAVKNANSKIEAKDVAAIVLSTKRRRATFFPWRHPVSRRRRR